MKMNGWEPTSSIDVGLKIAMKNPKKCTKCGNENRIDAKYCCMCKKKFGPTLLGRIDYLWLSLKIRIKSIFSK